MIERMIANDWTNLNETKAEELEITQ